MYLLTVNPILIAAAVIPAVILLVRVYKADRLDKEPPGLLISLVIMGIISTSIAVALENIGSLILGFFAREGTIKYNFLMFYGVVAFSEEGAKYVLLKKKTWMNRAFNCQFDGVVYSVFVSLGFALWENIGYVAKFGLSNAFARAITAIPGHASFGVFMGVMYGIAKRYFIAGNYEASAKYRKLSLLVPAFLHGTYDFLTTLGSVFSIIFIVFIVAMFIIAFRLVKSISANDSYLRNEPEDVYKSGDYIIMTPKNDDDDYHTYF